jgi:hypothetical protein
MGDQLQIAKDITRKIITLARKIDEEKIIKKSRL